jgi:hypothetical protein
MREETHALPIDQGMNGIWICRYYPKDGRLAEWFKAPVLKFAFPRFVQSSLVPTSAISSNKFNHSVLASPMLTRFVLERW